VIANVPDANAGAADYDTVELAFNTRVGEGLFFDTSYDFTWKKDLRTPEGTSNSPLTQADPISNGYFENSYPTIGNQQRTTASELHLSSHYELPHGVSVGANFELQSGWNYARVITVKLPNAGSQRFWLEDLSANRSDFVPFLNARVSKAWTFAGHRLTGMVDVFNLINSNAVLNFNLANGSRYGQINGALDPRTVEVGVRFEF
jgi:hypothetical protein